MDTPLSSYSDRIRNCLVSQVNNSDADGTTAEFTKQNGEMFNGMLRSELLNRETFATLIEAKILIEQWRKEYNQVRPHSVLNYRPPAPESIMPVTLT
jgi:hypothetical protein